ncbi:MAG: hypothetical protein NVSMB5_04880 [Candidatus Velthaea sp.]
MKRNIIAGLAAAAFATYVMDVVGEALYARQSDASKKIESEIEPKSALSILAERILRAVGDEGSDDDVARLSNAIHWAFGTSTGIAYAMLDPALPVLSKTFGVPVSLALYAFDELGLAAFGLTPPPQAFPVETHARALLNHLAYGAVLAVAYRGLLHLGPDGQA